MGLLEVLNIENRQATGTKKALTEVNPSLTVKQNWGKFRKQMERFDSSLIIDRFAGENYIELRCQQNHSKYRFERFMNLSLPMPSKGNSFRILDLLQSYFSEEVIDGV
jgi:ubiquitin C-terminal hydrolase